MKQKIKFFSMFAILAVLLFNSSSLFAQEWSAAQKEVWKNVETYWSLFAKGDYDGFQSYIHPDYRGWSNSSVLPTTKESHGKFLAFTMKNSKILVYDITPVAIQVYGNFAFVDYYFKMIEKENEGKTSSSSGRWTDILLKQDDKWLMIGDHGG